jgi:FkbH-like protein
MEFFIFRNMTIERFFSKYKASFSGYEDISFIEPDAERYIWFYLSPIKTENNVISAEIRNYINLLKLTISRIPSSKTLIVFTLNDIYSITTITGNNEIKEAIKYYNSVLYELATVHNNIKVFDFGNFLSRYSSAELIDWKYYFISQMALNPRLSNPFQDWFKEQIDSIELKRKKCLILDLDNTLWGGILGEDGIEGIQIGGDYPGKAYLMFQQQIEELGKQGIILAVCSKNNIEDVKQAWSLNNSIVLKENHFAALKINWINKADNIKELAQELNIGLDSMVFLDDNPSERELIKTVIPEVEVPDFPTQPYMLPEFFKSIAEKYFSIYNLTSEDLSKTRQYKENALRNNVKSTFTDMNDYIRSLEIELSIEEVNNITIMRAAQMTQKTNQFNLTTQRYTETDLSEMLNDGAKIYTLSVKDKFGDSGITGLSICKINGETVYVDSFLLSCRILGKGIEDAFMNWILNKLKQLNIKIINSKYISTVKNIQVKDFYERFGFEIISESESIKSYSLNLGDKTINLSDNYKYIYK